MPAFNHVIYLLRSERAGCDQQITGQGVHVKNPFQTIERRDIGISLDVTPVVMNNSTVIPTVKSKADLIKTKEDILLYLRTAFETDDLAYELIALEHAKYALKDLCDEAGAMVVIASDS